MVTDVVADMLESVGVWNMMSDSDESEDSDEDVKFDVDWVQRIISSIRKRSGNLGESLQPKKKTQTSVEMSQETPLLGVHVLQGLPQSHV